MTIYGYARVSSKTQSYDGQVDALRAAGCDEIVTEKLSAKSVNDRKAFQALLARLQPGDAVVVTKLDRAARNLRDLLNLVEDLGRRDIGFKSLGDPIDTTSLHGRLVTQILGCIAEFERGLIRERCSAGLERAKARGVKLGRKHVLDAHQRAEVQRMLAEGATQRSVARLPRCRAGDHRPAERVGVGRSISGFLRGLPGHRPMEPKTGRDSRPDNDAPKNLLERSDLQRNFLQ